MKEEQPSEGQAWSLLLFYFCLSICLNALGNALTVSINLGSALWTAGSVNVANATNLPLSWMLFISGVLIIIVNVLIVGKFSVQRVIGNLIFMFPFSYLVQAFSGDLLAAHITALPLVVRIVLDCFGTVLISTAISLYQRVNWMLHPADDLMQILRFKFFSGNSTVAQLITFTPPIVAIIITAIITHRIAAINVGTIFALLFQGTFVGIADRWVFPSLKHRKLDA